MEEHTTEESKVADLKHRYGGRTSADVRGSDAIAMTVIVANLMKEWNPILASVSDLKAIMGTPTKEESGVLEYMFDRGSDGDVWRFTVLDDIIAGVECSVGLRHASLKIMRRPPRYMTFGRSGDIRSQRSWLAVTQNQSRGQRTVCSAARCATLQRPTIGAAIRAILLSTGAARRAILLIARPARRTRLPRKNML
jgi:hypothetical protein